MKQAILTSICLLVMMCCFAQQNKNYRSLDADNPIVFSGSYIVYQEKKIQLGPHAFFIDGQLSDAEVANHKYVFNSVNKAAEHLTDGTEASPMVLYLAPYVYWLDNPDDPEIRVSKDSGPPYGLVVKCEWLRFQGLSVKAENVVLACNRGQTIGAVGNFTMFKFIGQGTSSENITFGNYCNVDLVYPLKPSLNREKRASAIVQAQLIHCNGDKIVARNTRFISRLNLNPFVGGKRVLFDRCHFESTDDALCGTGVYLNSTLDIYSSKPFYHTTGTGAIFLNCDIRSFSHDKQYFTKANGQVAVVDTRFNTEPNTYLGWRDVPPSETKNYQYQVTQNGQPILISKNDPASTVDMAAKPVLAAYRLEHKGKVIYNTYNLLAGDDGWDPMGVKPLVVAAEKEQAAKFTNLPVQLLLSPTNVAIETGKDKITLSARLMRFGNYEHTGEPINWRVAPEQQLLKLQVSPGGLTCEVIPTNENDDTRQVLVMASTASGLEAASVLQVAPSKLPPPAFSTRPDLAKPKNGTLQLAYKLDMRFADQSLVTWYRCTDAKGSNPIEVAVSRFDKPLLEYTLSAGDVGYYIMAAVAPKHIRSHVGQEVTSVLPKPIVAKDLKTDTRVLYTDFRNASTKNQPKVIPGFWTLDHVEQAEASLATTPAKTTDAWHYGEGIDGAANQTGLVQGRSASMRYTPVGNQFGDMKLTMTVAPYKTAGQGFSVAPLYMDVLIKFDAETKSGYALRFIRTTKYHDAIDCVFVKYENGKAVEISEPVTTTSYKPDCTITIEVKKDKILAHAITSAQQHKEPSGPEVVPEVKMRTSISPNTFGGFGIEYNGGSPTMIKDIKVEWQ
ncbi:hypothetical protein FVR03_17155 [Pontibacter qinzhouensis]|uniref:Pectinesterase catalytic domain-containing protein n=1 Tax=Pontibacter qinzhouensis TaxID=2603253 RepID=A0A5C8JGX6_9BACT|nr:hypothetical protein [Pontibacter qinzhouensis]TXK36662.1 hypothetical protein FVR03_17155 [Pontibacter qinzhouensis]